MNTINHIDYQYKALLYKLIFECKTLRENRTGIPALSCYGETIEHDMAYGFPLSGLRRLPEKGIRVETEFYLRGYTDKKWLLENGCHFWDSWQMPGSLDKYDLGPTYGFHWRHWGAEYKGRLGAHYGFDQLSWALSQLKDNKGSRQVLITQWRPDTTHIQALPACIFSFQLLFEEERLNLIYYQRSADMCLGFPNDFAQFALILHLFCLELGCIPGKVIAMISLAEIYENHIQGAKELLATPVHTTLPEIRTENFSGVLNWHYNDSAFIGINKQATKIKFEIAV